MHNFRELKIWQRSMDFVVEIYQLCAQLPSEEKYGLVSQLKRSAVSVPSNISEGAGRATNPQFQHFLEISMGSCNELITQIELAFRLKFVLVELRDKLTEEATQIYKMILGFYNSLK
jgi:four helix bundle protein